MRTVALVCLLAVACAPTGDEERGGIGGKADDPSGGDVDIPALASSYALRIDGLFRSCTRDIDDSDGDGVTDECDGAEVRTDELVLLGLWTPQQDGAEAHGPLALCGARSVADGNTLTVDDDVLRSLAPIELGGRLVSVDGAPTLAGDPSAFVVGADLDDPFSDALPTEPDDPRVVDVDDDGEPGLSVGAAIGSVYLAMRVIVRLEGPVAADASSRGAPELEVDQSVYGDSIPFVDARALAEESAETSMALDGDHRYELAPIVDGSGCDDVVERLGDR